MGKKESNPDILWTGGQTGCCISSWCLISAVGPIGETDDTVQFTSDQQEIQKRLLKRASLLPRASVSAL